MNNKERKLIQTKLACHNIDFFFDLLDNRFNCEFDKEYVKEIKKLSEGFNIRLKREQKLKFCRKCNSYLDISTREIRFNPKTFTKDYICKNCGCCRSFKYK